MSLDVTLNGIKPGSSRVIALYYVQKVSFLVSDLKREKELTLRSSF